MRALFRQFSFPGGIPRHVAPETPGSIHEGGELGYALSHAFGAAFDNPDLRRRVRGRRRRGGDRAARDELALEQVPEPRRRRRRPADPAPERLQDRQPDRAGPHSRARAASRCSRATAGDLDVSASSTSRRRCAPAVRGRARQALDEIAAIQRGGPRAAATSDAAAMADDRPAQPQGLDRPREVDGMQVEGTWRVAPGPARATRAKNAEHLRSLEEWLRSYRPEELFDETGSSCPSLRALRAARRAAHEREPARERRRAPRRPRDARLPRLRGRRAGAGTTIERGDARARRVPARRDRPEPAERSASSAPTRPRRTGSARVRRHRANLGRRDVARRTSISPPTAG